MAFSYRWRDITDEVSRMVKGVPIKNWALYCDMVSSDMFTSYPWKDALQNIATGQIPLVDGQQDYDVPTNIFRLTKASIVRTDVSPEQHYELDVQMDLDVDLTPRSYVTLKAASLQAGVGKLRLDAAVQVPAGMLLELRGEYQISNSKVRSLTDWLWFDDHYAHVAMAGLMYWAYKLADDSRAGTAQNSKAGTIYTGQLGEYKSALQKMKEDEEYGPSEQYYPSESMGSDRDWSWLGGLVLPSAGGANVPGTSHYASSMEGTIVGAINGVNGTFSLPSQPQPSTNLQWFWNGTKIAIGTGILVSGSTVQCQAGYIPNTGDTLEAYW